MAPQHPNRDATARPRFVALDGLRAVGATAVLATHAGFQSGDALQGPFAGVLARMDAGVALFFVISGFLLFRPHVAAHLDGRSQPNVRRYLWHRAVRILPVLWIAVAAAALLLHDADPALYLAHALLIQIYIPEHYVHGLTQMWSLATEVAFYLALPLVGRLLCRGGRDRRWILRISAVLGLMTLAGPAWMYTVTAMGYSLPRLWLPGFIGWFATGMLFAVWSVGWERGIIRSNTVTQLVRYPGTMWALALGVFALATSPVAGPLDLSPPTPAQAATKSILYCLLGALIVVPAIPRDAAPSPLLRVLSGRVGRVLGDVSYGLFAYHVVILALVDRALALELFDGRFMIRFWPTLIVSLLVAGLSYRLLEAPLMRWARGVRLAGSGDSPTRSPRTPRSVPR